MFDIESFDYGYYDEGSEGLKVFLAEFSQNSLLLTNTMFQVAIVHHLDMPIMRQRAFHIAPGTENQIPITPTLYTANPQVRRCLSDPAQYFLLNIEMALTSADQFLFVLAIFTLPSLLFALNFKKIAFREGFREKDN